MTFIHPHPKGMVIKVFVQPRSSKNLIVGPHGDTLKIKLTAPPVAGEANRLCIKFLAKFLGVPKTSMEIISGANGRNKRVLIHETSVEGKRKIRSRIQTSIDKI